MVLVPKVIYGVRIADTKIREVVNETRIHTIKSPYRRSFIEFWSVEPNVTERDHLLRSLNVDSVSFALSPKANLAADVTLRFFSKPSRC